MTLICVTVTVMRERSRWFHPFSLDSWHSNPAVLIESCKLAFITKVIYTFNGKKITIRKYRHKSCTYLPTLTLASYWSISDFKAVSKSHLSFQCISINVLKLAFRVWFQMAGIMFPAKIKALVSYSVIVKALLQYHCTINQERLCYLWEVLPSWYFHTASFRSSLFSACYFSFTVIVGRT